MEHPRAIDRTLRLLTRKGVLRPKDLAEHGLPRVTLTRLVEQGLVERVGRGLYVLAGAEPSEHRSLAEAAVRVPHGVVCLLSALAFHGLTTQVPHQVWMAIPSDARRPRARQPPLRVVRMAADAYRYGVKKHRIEGVTVRVYTVPKTVADCFKFRGRIGQDIAVEALRDALSSRAATRDAIWRAAGVCRVRVVMRPYLEAIG